MTFRARKILVLACVVFIDTLQAQPAPETAAGTWRGSYQPPPFLLPLVVKFSRTATGLAAETQSPNQNLAFSPVDSVAVDKSHVEMIQSRFNALFKADLSGNALTGTLSQQGNTNKVVLVHVLPDGTNCKPQDLLVGEWRGTVELRPAPMLFVLSVAGAGANLGATIQTPSTNPTAFPVDAISYSNGTLTFRQSMAAVDFTGTISGLSLSGTLTQNGYSTPIVLQRQAQ